MRNLKQLGVSEMSTKEKRAINGGVNVRPDGRGCTEPVFPFPFPSPTGPFNPYPNDTGL